MSLPSLKNADAVGFPLTRAAAPLTPPGCRAGLGHRAGHRVRPALHRAPRGRHLRVRDPGGSLGGVRPGGPPPTESTDSLPRRNGRSGSTRWTDPRGRGPRCIGCALRRTSGSGSALRRRSVHQVRDTAEERPPGGSAQARFVTASSESTETAEAGLASAVIGRPTVASPGPAEAFGPGGFGPLGTSVGSPAIATVGAEGGASRSRPGDLAPRKEPPR